MLKKPFFMKKVAVTMVFVLSMLGGGIFAQNINFEHISFEEALVKAREQNKLIFIDFYTVWCGPCKLMSNNIFTDSNVADLFNKEFINLKIDAEKEGGVQVAKKYGVSAYPTLAFINAKGELMYKNVGALDVPKTIKMGQDALATTGNGQSLVSLKEQFASKQNDEKFLKLYFNKMIESGESAIEGIEAWLKVQKEIKEKDVAMMEFLINNNKYLIVDGKAAEILDANYDEYLSYATDNETRSLQGLRAYMVNNTKKAALEQKDPVLMRAFITNWKKLPEGRLKSGNLADFELEYLLLNKDYAAFKKNAKIYFDSIMTAKTLDQIRAEDKITYDDYVKKVGPKATLVGDGVKANLKDGKIAHYQMNAIVKFGNAYLRIAENKSDYKQLMIWIDYGMKLVPTNYTMDSFKANVFFKQGKIKEAIAFKTAALEKLSPNDNVRGGVVRDLEEMKKKLKVN